MEKASTIAIEQKNKSNKFILPTIGVFLVLSLVFSFLFIFNKNPFNKSGEPADVLVQQPAGVCSLRFSVDEKPTPPTPKNAYVQCKKLEAVVVDRGDPIDSPNKYSLNSVPDDFSGTLWLTCYGEAKNTTITKMNFRLTKTVGSNSQNFTSTLNSNQIQKVNSSVCLSGTDCYKGVTKFDIDGPGNFKANSEVCGTSPEGDYICSGGDRVNINSSNNTDG